MLVTVLGIEFFLLLALLFSSLPASLSSLRAPARRAFGRRAAWSLSGL